MNLQYSYSTAKHTRDFFEMIVRYINVLLLLLLLSCSIKLQEILKTCTESTKVWDGFEYRQGGQKCETMMV